jgi:hypothetical protein
MEQFETFSNFKLKTNCQSKLWYEKVLTVKMFARVKIPVIAYIIVPRNDR